MFVKSSHDALRSAGTGCVPYLRWLAARTGLAVGLAVLNDLELGYLLRVRGGEVERNRLAIETGSRLPAYCTAAGKVLLAGLEEDERTERVQQISFEEDPEVPTDWTAESLWSALEVTRQDHLGINDEESALGIQAIAVGVENAGGEVVAALNLVGWQPHTSIRRMLVDHLDALQRIAEISVIVDLPVE